MMMMSDMMDSLLQAIGIGTASNDIDTAANNITICDNDNNKRMASSISNDNDNNDGNNNDTSSSNPVKTANASAASNAVNGSNDDILLKVLEIGDILLVYTSMKDIVNLFSINKVYNAVSLVPEVVLQRTMSEYMKRRFDGPLQSFGIVSLPKYPYSLNDLKSSYQVMKSLKCCFCMRAMLRSFSKLSSVAISSGDDYNSYNFEITNGDDRKFVVKVTGTFCNEEESISSHSGDYLSLIPATCGFCDCTNCRICGEYSSCVECNTLICVACEDSYFQCENCDSIFCDKCDDHYDRCDTCSVVFCADCSDMAVSLCENCDQYYCDGCDTSISCNNCGTNFCSSCSDDCIRCDSCGILYCHECEDEEMVTCEACEESRCKACTEMTGKVVCQGCQTYYCPDCSLKETEICSQCSETYCLATASNWRNCCICGYAKACDNCVDSHYSHCQNCKKKHICPPCASEGKVLCDTHLKKKRKKRRVSIGDESDVEVSVPQPLSANDDDDKNNDDNDDNDNDDDVPLLLDISGL